MSVVSGPVLDPTKNPPSPKVIALAVVMLVVPGVSAALLYLTTDEGARLYATLPVWLVIVVRSLIAGLLAHFAGFRFRDPQRVLDLATSPKVIFGVLAGVVLQAVVDLVAFLMSPDGNALYASLPPVLVVAISAVLPAIAAGLTGYIVKDPARVTPQNPVPDPKEPVEITAATPEFQPGAAGIPGNLQRPPAA